jgi:hypothetical protein
MPAHLVSVSSAVWSGFRSGGLSSFAVRPSGRSSSGVVAVLSFSSPAAAGRFAARAARRAGVSVAVRLVGGLWAVSVPVSSGCSPAVRWGARCGGGVRRVAALLRLWAALAPVVV